MTRNFCTYFDKNYLLRGLALYRSLVNNCPEFRLWILCMDKETYKLLVKLNLKNVTAIRLEDFEDEKLLEVKISRSLVEYYWTCTPFLPLYVLSKNSQLDMISYIDADLYFFSSPEPIYEEFGNDSIMIIPHRYLDDQKAREKTSGIYNVSMVIFRNDKNGLECLNWWKERCLEWCYFRQEDGKMGDQLYLNDWPERFMGVCILENHGANVALWNVERYSFFKKKGEEKIWQKNKKISEIFPLIFYHFHATKFYDIFWRIHIYSKETKKLGLKLIFREYAKALLEMKKKVEIAIKSPMIFGFSPNSDYLKRAKKKIAVNLYKLLKTNKP